MTGDTLRNLLRALGEKKRPTRKAEMAAFLRDIWQATPQRLVDKLSEPERLMLAECVHEEHPFPSTQRVNARFGLSYSIPYKGGDQDAHFIHCFIYRPDR
ncbi:MAG: hypothetical protein GY801_30605, partial [bacterium]|nr:hypothetical protein [bacterium]